MAKKEAKTDLWVYELLQEANIKLTPQGCDIKEINEALKTASKSNTGNAGYPEYCGVVKDFILVIEDKASLDKHLYLKSATKLFSVLLASKRPLITELADKLRLKYPLLPTISPCPTRRLEAIRSIIPISCRRYPKSV